MTENQNFEVQTPIVEKSPAATAKRLLTGKGFLFVVIFQVVTLIFSLVNAFGNQGAFSAVMDEVAVLNESMDMTLSDILEAISPYTVTVDSALFGISFISLIPSILLTVGLALMHFGAKKNDDKMAATGAYIASIFAAINLIVPIFYILVAILIGIVVLAFEPSALTAVIIAVGFFMIPFVITIIYYSKLIDTLIGLRNTLKTGIHACKVYSYVVVLNWIVAVCELLSGVSALTSNISGAIASILSAVSLIVITLTLSNYKNAEGIPSYEEMKRAKQEVRNMK